VILFAADQGLWFLFPCFQNYLRNVYLYTNKDLLACLMQQSKKKIIDFFNSIRMK